MPGPYGGIRAELDVRTLCLARERLAYHSALADFAFAMQGLGGGPVALFGNAELKRRYLPEIAAGRCIAAFALSELEAGSDVAALATTRPAATATTSSTARRRGSPTPASPISTSSSRGPASGRKGLERVCG